MLNGEYIDQVTHVLQSIFYFSFQFVFLSCFHSLNSVLCYDHCMSVCWLTRTLRFNFGLSSLSMLPFLFRTVPHSSFTSSDRFGNMSAHTHNIECNTRTQRKRREFFSFCLFFPRWSEMEKPKPYVFSVWMGKRLLCSPLCSMMMNKKKERWRNSTYQYTTLNRINATVLVNL